MTNFLKFSCVLLLALLIFSVDVRADPIQIVNGTASIRFSGNTFNLNDANGNRYFGTSIGSTGTLPTYQAGSTFNPVVNLFSTLGYSDYRGTYSNGISNFPVVYLGLPGPSSTPASYLTFSSASFLLPVQTLPTFSMQIPFTMQGLLVAVGDCTSSFPLCNQVLANNSLSGSGTATYNFFSQNGMWQMSGANYSFDNASPTPEPATLILMGTGLAGIIGYARKRRKKQAD
jgi:PEP-CTERM motif